MKVWIVSIFDCEGSEIKSVCLTKTIAETELFKLRDKLTKEWKRMDKWRQHDIEENCKRRKVNIYIDDEYKTKINNLKSNNYKNWDNYPFETPNIEVYNIIK